MRKRIAFALGICALCWGQDSGRWWRHVSFLADDKLEGRNTGSVGHKKAADYVAAEFERAGLKPAGEQGYLQPVKFDTRVIDEAHSSVTVIRGDLRVPLQLGAEVMIGLRSNPAAEVEAPLVFAGYGLTAPEQDYDDFRGADAKGKIVVFVAGAPPSLAGALGSHYQSAGERVANLRRVGAVGMIQIPNPNTSDVPWARASLARLTASMSLADPALDEGRGMQASLTMNPAFGDKLLAGSGHTMEEIWSSVKRGEPVPSFTIPAKVRVVTAVERGQVESQNVVAVLPGSDPVLRNEYVVMSAHLDHLGTGPAIGGDSIYNGAMDNASGVAALLDVAAGLRESGTAMKRSVLFVAVTGEEKGLLGSRYFANHPTIPKESLVADLNLDMFLPLFPLKMLTVYGLKESDLGDEVAAVAEASGLRIQADPEPLRNVFIRSDQYSFIRRGIPSITMKFGYEKGSPEEELAKRWLRERYHAPSDDLQQPLDRKAAGEFDAFAGKLLRQIANRSQRPQWKQDSFFKRYTAKS